MEHKYTWRKRQSWVKIPLTDLHIDYLHSPKGLLGTPVQFLINAII